MIEIVIPKDIRKYEAKLIGPFTMRQCICFVGAAVLDILAYKPISNLAGPDIAVMACLLIAAPFIVCGWLKIYGMPAEVFIRSTFTGMFLAPKHRVYKIRNIYTQGSKFKKLDEKAMKKRLKKEKKLAKSNPDYERIL